MIDLDFHSSILELLSDAFSSLDFPARQEPALFFDQGHLAAQGATDRCKLAANVARTNDGQALRKGSYSSSSSLLTTLRIELAWNSDLEPVATMMLSAVIVFLVPLSPIIWRVRLSRNSAWPWCRSTFNCCNSARKPSASRELAFDRATIQSDKVAFKSSTLLPNRPLLQLSRN